MMQGAPPFGWDFAVFWAIGRAVLHGLDPYAVWGSWYPPATSILFSLFALSSPATMFVVWTSVNLLCLSAVSKRQPVRWLMYSPVIFVIAAGQIDLFFLWLSTFLKKRGWTAAVAGALLTLKPQLAFILLPWWGVQWLRSDRSTLGKFGIATVGLHALPLLYDPAIYSHWITNIMEIGSARNGHAPSFMGLTYYGLPLWSVALLSAAVLGAAIFLTNERMTRVSAALANPAIMMYDHVVLIGTAPWWLMVPMSWIAWPVAYHLHSFVPFIIIPLTAFAWNLYERMGHHDTDDAREPAARRIQRGHLANEGFAGGLRSGI